MIFSDYLDSIENTEQEQQLIEKFASVAADMEKATKVPLVGKKIGALIALGSAESIAAFRETEHYDRIKDWDVSINLETGSFSLSPSSEQKKKIVKIAVAAGVVILLSVLCCKCCAKK